MSDEMRPPVKVDCFDQSCSGPATFSRIVTEKKGRKLLEGHCRECGVDQVIVYELRNTRVLYRAMEVEKIWKNAPVDKVDDDGTFIWTEWHDRNGARVGYLMDGCFRMDLGPIHISNGEETDFWKRVDPGDSE